MLIPIVCTWLICVAQTQDIDALLGEFRANNAAPVAPATDYALEDDFDPANGEPPVESTTPTLAPTSSDTPAIVITTTQSITRTNDLQCRHSVQACTSDTIDHLHSQLSPGAQTVLPSTNANLQFCRTREGTGLNSWKALRTRVVDKDAFNEQEGKQQSYCLQQLWTEQANCARVKNYMCAGRSKGQCLNAIDDLRVRTDRDECGQIKVGGQEKILEKEGVISAFNPFEEIELVTYAPVGEESGDGKRVESDPFSKVARPKDVPGTPVEQLISGIRETGPLLSRWQPTSIKSSERSEQAVNAAKSRHLSKLQDSFAKFQLPTKGGVATGGATNVGIPGLGPIGSGVSNVVTVYEEGQQGGSGISPSQFIEVIEGPRPYFHEDLTFTPLSLAGNIRQRRALQAPAL